MAKDPEDITLILLGLFMLNQIKIKDLSCTFTKVNKTKFMGFIL